MLDFIGNLHPATFSLFVNLSKSLDFHPAESQALPHIKTPGCLASLSYREEMVVALGGAQCYRKIRNKLDPVPARKSFSLVDVVRCAQQPHVQGCRINAFREGCNECAEETVWEGFLEDAALN